MCSATFLGVLGQFALEQPVVVLGLAPGPRAGDRPRGDDPLPQAHHRFGRGADHGDLGKAQEVQVGTRVEQAQGAVHVERVGAEIQVVALGQHDLEDVPRRDVLLGRRDAGPVLRRRQGPRGLRLREARGRRRQQLARARPGAVRRQLAQPEARGLVGLRHSGGVDHTARSVGHHDVVDQHDALAPMVERTELPDHHQCGVGVPQVVGGRMRESLDLSHHVIAEVADQPAVKRWQARERRGAEPGHQVLDRRQDAVLGVA